MLFRHFTQGFQRAWSHKRVVFIFYLTNLVFTFLATRPMALTLKNVSENRLFSEQPYGLLSDHFLMDLLQHYIAPIQVSVFMLFMMVIIFLFVRIFLSGGLFAVFNEGKAYEARLFWGNAGHMFAPFVRLGVLLLPSLVVYFLPAIFFFIGSSFVVGDDPYEGTELKIWATAALLVFFALFLYARTFDYGRMYLVRNNSTRARSAAGFAMVFFLKKAPTIIVLGLLYVVCGVVLWMVYNATLGLFPAGDYSRNLLYFAVLQIGVVLRVFTRISAYGGHFGFFASQVPQPVTAAVEAPQSAAVFEEVQCEECPPAPALGTDFESDRAAAYASMPLGLGAEAEYQREAPGPSGEEEKA